jgi:pimeloyl-ACP methyl ester carboxylesterase
MTKFGGGEYKGHSSIWASMIFPLVKSPEYGLFKLPGYAKGAFWSLEQLWDQVVEQDFWTSVPELKMPVYLTEGRHDQNTPPVLAQRWFDALKAPKKQWIWFEESAHSPIKEEPGKWGKELLKIVKETVRITRDL